MKKTDKEMEKAHKRVQEMFRKAQKLKEQRTYESNEGFYVAIAYGEDNCGIVDLTKVFDTTDKARAYVVYDMLSEAMELIAKIKK